MELADQILSKLNFIEEISIHSYVTLFTQKVT